MAYDRVGRAYIRPLHRQVHDPRPGLTESVRQSLLWWHAYLVARPVRWHFPAAERSHAVMWTDASGEDGKIAAVVAADGLLFFTHMAVPESFYAQLLERGDNQIGVLEALAVWLGIQTFCHLLRGRTVSLFEDNRGVLFSFLKGSSRCPETNFMIAKFWLWAALVECHVVLYWVESHANISDGPTRGRVRPLPWNGAVEVDPVLPA